MTSAEKRELAALAVVTAAAGALSASLPRRVALADVLLVGAAFLLVQGLVRDVGRLRRERAEAAAALAPPLRCVCVESTLGVGAIVAGSALLFAWTPIVFAVARVAWPLAVAGLGGFGFLTKDFVFDWRTRALTRDPTHGRARGL
jgi:hypothetical protein